MLEMWLLSQPMAGSLLAEVEAGRVVRLAPLDENSPLDSSHAEEVKRWWSPQLCSANTPLKEIPAVDPLGDALQAAARQAAKRWSPDLLQPREFEAIQRARAQGKYFKARLQERMARGKFVENVLREQFKQLRWSRTGVDAVDPATGLKYEILWLLGRMSG